MRTLPILLSLALLPLDPLSAAEPDMLRVGHPSIDASAVRMRTARYERSVSDDTGQLRPTSGWSERVELIQRDGRDLIRHTVEDGDTTRVILVDADDLAPVSVHEVTGDSLEALYLLHFKGDRVAASRADSTRYEVEMVEVSLETPTFDRSARTLLALSLPFERGFRAHLPVAELRGGGLVAWETYTVVRQDRMAIGDQVYDAWVVRIEQPDWTLWLREDAPQVLKIDRPNPEDLDRREVSYWMP